MPVGAAIGGAAVIGGVATTRASDRTARAAETTAANNNALQGQIYQQNRATQTPFLNAGNRSMDAWMSMMGLAPQANGVGTASVSTSGAVPNALSPGGRGYPGLAARDILADQQAERAYGAKPGDNPFGPQINPGLPGTQPSPGVSSPGAPAAGGAGNAGFEAFKQSLGYQAALDEGNRALNLRLGNRGQLLSGDAAREAVRFNSNFAHGFAGNYLDRLMQGTMLGAGAANALSGVGTSYANAVGANNNNALNVQAGAWQNGAQGLNDMAGNIAGGIAYGYGNNWGRNPASTASSYQPASSGSGRPIFW
mgnify:CR=1 FL=1